MVIRKLKQERFIQVAALGVVGVTILLIWGNGQIMREQTGPHSCFIGTDRNDLSDANSTSAQQRFSNFSLTDSFPLDQDLDTQQPSLQMETRINPYNIIFGIDDIFVTTPNANAFALDSNTSELKDLDISINEFPVSRITFSPDGTLYGFANVSSEFRVWNLEDVGETFQIPLDRNEVGVNLYFPPNNRCAVVTGSYSHIRFVDMTTGIERERIVTEGFISGIDFTVDGRHLAYATFGDNDSSGDIIVSMWDLATNQQVLRQHLDFPVTDLALHPYGNGFAFLSGDELYVSSNHNEIVVTHQNLKSIDFGVNGYIVGGDAEGNITFWDAQTGNTLHHEKISHFPIMEVLLSPNQQLLLTLDTSGILTLWKSE